VVNSVEINSLNLFASDAAISKRFMIGWSSFYGIQLCNKFNIQLVSESSLIVDYRMQLISKVPNPFLIILHVNQIIWKLL